MKKKITKKSSDTIKLAAIGAGLAGLAATAYFFLGPKGKKHQKHFKSWAIKMKGDVIEKLETARELSEPVYNKIIDSVATKYEKSSKASQKEINELAKNLKEHWKTISKSVETAKRNATKSIGKKTKKTKK